MNINILFFELIINGVTNEQVLIDLMFKQSFESNGVHTFKFYTCRDNFGKKWLIKYSDFLKYSQSQNNFRLSQISHVGFKQQLLKDFWIFSLFTSKASSENGFQIIENIALQDNMFSYVNPSMIVSNEIFSQYYTISDNLIHFPKFTKENFDLSKKNELNECILQIMKDSISGYKEAVIGAQLTDPYVIVDTLWCKLNNFSSNNESAVFKKNIILNHLEYSQKIEYLNKLGITKNDIFNFINNFLNEQNSKNKSIFDNNLFFEESNKRIKY